MQNHDFCEYKIIHVAFVFFLSNHNLHLLFIAFFHVYLQMKAEFTVITSLSLPVIRLQCCYWFRGGFGGVILLSYTWASQFNNFFVTDMNVQ